uniref:Uncharacterized protein n=1 Tax=Trypanosoma vivax (strain Y486) TaxID=1055687 RepID=G0TUZ6_TRYVY|nr:conserved hypothetical protein [Trypanosoma vivax Y486]
MLVLYLLARHPMHGYEYSAELVQEAAEWQDVITLPMREGQVTTDKKIGDTGFWGFPAEVGVSRKSFMWFDLALRLLPSVKYISKGDDDAFHHAPQFIADLRVLPRRGVYWGRVRLTDDNKFLFARGLMYTLSRDMARKFVSYEPTRRLVYMPFKQIKRSEYEQQYLQHEDRMVGNTFYMNHVENIVYVHEDCCRYTVLNDGECPFPGNRNFVIIHGIAESDYSELMKPYGNATLAVPATFVPVPGGLKAMC